MKTTEELTTKELILAIFGLICFSAVFISFSFWAKRIRPHADLSEVADIHVGNLGPIICRDDPDIKFYDNEDDLVYIDKGLKGCERWKPSKRPLILGKMCTTTGCMYYGSGRAEDIKRNMGLYEERQFNRNDYDTGRFFIRE